MATRYILSEYVQQAMSEALYDKLEDGTFAGRIPSCKGVLAFSTTLRDCEDELHSTLEDWILVGLKIGHLLPVIGEIDLNKALIKTLGRLSSFFWNQTSVYGLQQHRMSIPSNVEYSIPQLRMMMKEVEGIIGRDITTGEWNTF
jgi:predicted RNase H-like HicB family nuclease